MRLEKAFRDMGHDIDSTDTPLEAGLGFAVAWNKTGGFVGRDALLKQRESGPLTRRLVNVLLASPDHDLFGDEPVYWDGKPVGHVRSGGFGHSLGASCGIAGIARDEGIAAAGPTRGSFEIDVAGPGCRPRCGSSRSSTRRARASSADRRASMTWTGWR